MLVHSLTALPYLQYHALVRLWDVALAGPNMIRQNLRLGVVTKVQRSGGGLKLRVYAGLLD